MTNLFKCIIYCHKIIMIIFGDISVIYHIKAKITTMNNCETMIQTVTQPSL